MVRPLLEVQAPRVPLSKPSLKTTPWPPGVAAGVPAGVRVAVTVGVRVPVGVRVTVAVPVPAGVRVAVGTGVPAPPKLYVCTSKVRPVESVGLTVTWVPFTRTSRKWNTCAREVGRGALPQALPPPAPPFAE